LVDVIALTGRQFPAATSLRDRLLQRITFMNWHAIGLRRLDTTIWALIALVAAFMLSVAAFSDFTVILRSFIAPASCCLLLKLGAYYYRDWRNDPNLASALESTTQLMAFAAVAAPLSYVAASASLPLQDAALARLDYALGFNWKGLLAFMHRWSNFFKLMHLIYLSLSLQMVAAVLLLGFTGRLPWLRVYMLSFIFAALITIAISTFLPAEGAWLHYGITGPPEALPLSHTNWPVFFGLRDGSFRQLIGVGAEGIITFPSLHAALAAILVAAFWPIPAARWFAVLINCFVVVATPIDGSHYFVDVLAGIAIAGLCVAAAQAVARRLAPPPATIEIWSALPGSIPVLTKKERIAIAASPKPEASR
jgi:membrane-associated phospholipid phosphatase